MSGANLRKFILFDQNGRELDLTTQSNVPVELVDSNGLNLDLTAQSNVPVAVKDTSGQSLEMFLDGAVPVRERHQSAPTIILPSVNVIGSDTLALAGVLFAYTVTVTSSAGMTTGDHFRIVDTTDDKFYFGEIVSIAGNVITLDTQLDFAYSSGSEVTYSSKNLAVNGSVTPVSFVARTGTLSIPAKVNITRVIFTCIATSAVSLPLFGNLAKLTRGVALRKVNTATTRNVFNVKNNEEFTNIAFDFTVFQATNPAQGVDGFVTRITFGGESKMGTVIQIDQTENMEILVQDDLTGLTRLTATFEGNIVQD